jgi:cell division protein FtsQ
MSSVFTLRPQGRDELLVARLLTVVVIAVACGLALYLAGRLFILPALTITRVLVESDSAVAEGDMLAQAGLQGAEYYHTVQTAVIERRLEANPLIRRARVTRVFPNAIRIQLTRREAVALVLADSGGRSVPLLVDRDGVVFGTASRGAELDLPVVTGVPLPEASAGARLPAAAASLLSDLAALRTKSPSLYRLLSEVRVVSPGSGSPGAAAGSVPAPTGAQAHADPTSSVAAPPELLLYLVNTPVRIRASGGIDDALLKYSLMVIDLLSNQGHSRDIGELDFRGGEVVYRMKEG